MSALALTPDAAQPRGSALWAGRALNVLIGGLLIALVLGVALRASGYTALVDYTDSMRPAITAGDVVLDRSVAAGALRPGQIASIPDPGQGGRLVTHRVVSVVRVADTATIVTRGDANNAGERWVLPANARVRRMSTRVPWVGHIVVWLASPLLRALLLAAGALALAAAGIARLREAR